jgi:hypothetical protein
LLSKLIVLLMMGKRPCVLQTAIARGTNFLAYRVSDLICKVQERYATDHVV